MSKPTDRYAQRGVSASKSEVHKAIKNLDKGLFPTAFCKVLPDLVGQDKEWCNIMHADTAGTKTSLAYLYWKETGDISVWKGIAQDAIVMNIDDMACVGAIENIVISSTIGRNAHLIPGEVIEELIQGGQEFFESMQNHGISINLAGGETADVGDIVRTIDVGYTTFARMRRQDVLVNQIRPGDVIIGFASDGMASYEQAYNSGIGSNGLTSARHDVLAKDYARLYPECFDPNTLDEFIFSGSRKLTEKIRVSGYDERSIGQLLLSPTRTFLPLIKEVLDKHKPDIHGMIHCTGGAHTKVLKFVDGVAIHKNKRWDIPPIFQIIKDESNATWEEMFKVFNMGIRLEIYANESVIGDLISIGNQFNIKAQVIGHVEEDKSKHVRLSGPEGEIVYTP